jgi:four helix bundle protein
MNQKPTSYQDLIVWQKAMDLVDQIYKIVRLLPKSEYYILGSQMLRAAISIPSNIAEGFRRKSKAEYGHHLSIALGSAAELETQISIVNRQYSNINTDKSLELANEVQKMLNKMTSNYMP